MTGLPAAITADDGATRQLATLIAAVSRLVAKTCCGTVQCASTDRCIADTCHPQPALVQCQPLYYVGNVSLIINFRLV